MKKVCAVSAKHTIFFGKNGKNLTNNSGTFKKRVRQTNRRLKKNKKGEKMHEKNRKISFICNFGNRHEHEHDDRRACV